MKCRNNVDSTQAMMGLLFCDLSLVSLAELKAGIKAAELNAKQNQKTLHQQNAHQYAAQFLHKSKHELRPKQHDYPIQQPAQRGFKR
jgi:hypothetical protein